MKTLSVSEFKVTCLAVLKTIKKTGQPILVTRHGEPLAEIRPPQPPPLTETWLGSMADFGEIVGDIIEPIATKDWDALQ